jgi:allantoinase
MSLPRSYLEYPRRKAGMDHDRFEYRSLFDRGPVQWPDGARVALVVVPVLEWFPLDIMAGATPVRVTGAMERPYPQ